MAAPDHVPVLPGARRLYSSPPRRDASWRAERPGDIPTGMPEGEGFGSQGPDQGYALKLVRQFEDQVHLHGGERWSDAAAGAVFVALKRASLFGRAPVRHDLEIAFRVWGFLDESAPDELVTTRRRLFDRVESPHHYAEARHIVELVPERVLRATPQVVAAAYKADWRAQLGDLAADPHSH